MNSKILVAALLAGISAMGVSAEVRKNMVVRGTDGSKVSINRDNIESVKFSEAPEYSEANTLLSAVYQTKNGLGRYEFCIATGAPDAGGDPAAVGEFQLNLAVVGAMSDEAAKAAIPAGYYRAGNGNVAGAFDISGTSMWLRTGEGEDGTDVVVIVGGSVDVRPADDGTYDIRCELTTLDGAEVNARYQGPIKFVAGLSEYLPFYEDQDVTFTRGQSYYWGNWYFPFADDLVVELFSGEFEGGSQVSGHYLHIDMYMPKSADPEGQSVVADGVYTVDAREGVQYYTNIPLTFRPGQKIDIFGQELLTGTYLTYVDKAGVQRLACVTGGTVTVTGGGQTFEVALTTDDGIAITGTFSSSLNFINKCDNSMGPERPFSKIESDLVFDFPQNAVGLAYNLGDYVVPGMNVFAFMLCEPDMKVGDYLQFEVMCSGDRLTDGTYAVNNSLSDKTAFIGCASSTGTILFSWYGDLDSTDEEGVQTVMAPVNGGSFTITTDANGQSTVTFDLVDDKGNAMTGSWIGTIQYPSLPQTAPKALKRVASAK